MNTAPADLSAATTIDPVQYPPQQDGGAAQRIAAHCRLYQGADLRRSIVQLATTLAMFIGLAVIMIGAVQHGLWWISALLWLPAGGLLVRIFIIQHDCGHGSYFKTRGMNDLVGRGLSLLTFTPYSFWRDAHNIHHAGSGDLSRRGIGSIDTLTVREYESLPRGKKYAYRLYRHPLVVLLLGPPLYVILIQRLPLTAKSSYFENYRSLPYAKIWRSILALDAALVLFYGTLATMIGFGVMTAIFLPPVIIASWVGGWLFFVQHQFEDTYWKQSGEWNFREAALHGSSHYVLPRILQWFTGNIGIHHIHHLCSAIPNYRLQECMENDVDLRSMNRMSIMQSLRSIPLALWDEDQKKMAPFPKTAK